MGAVIGRRERRGLPARLARQVHDAGHAARFTVAGTNADAMSILRSP